MTKNLHSISLLITGGPIITMNAAGQIFEDGAVAIDGTDIVWVGPRTEVEAQVSAQTTLDAAGQIIMPGLVNTHTHAAMTLFRGFADDINLEPWLEKIWRIESRYATTENVRVGAALAFVEMIQSGTTTAADMYWQRVETTDLAREVGFRLVNGPSFIDFTGPDGIHPHEREAAARDFLARYQDDPLIESCIQVHATYSVPTKFLEEARQMKEEFDLLFVTHASETRTEVATLVERYQKTPIEYLDALGLLDSKTLLAHCVHLRDDEIELLARRGVSVAHCPESNLKLGSGMARVADMLAAGVNVSLGTDGAATNNDLDMWGEMQTASLLQKGLKFDSTALPAPQTLQMATIKGARALGLADKIGSLEVGKRADVILLDFDQPHLTPLFNLYSHLVYAANKADVQSVVINGQIVMQNRQLLTLDEAAIKAEARHITRNFETI
jgi:5-methylthioadenosine/S-adenosylhomocysteine deaminase